MPRPNPPPLTAKKAKQLYQKSGKRFEFTASQFRAAERREELDERRKKEEAKEERKKTNKRKREDKDERERASKRQQLAQGKIRPEDLWTKVGASQPRLNNFFRKREVAPQKSLEEQDQATTTEDESGSYSEEDTFVDPRVPQVDGQEKISEEELVPFSSIGLAQQPSHSPSQTHNTSSSARMEPAFNAVGTAASGVQQTGLPNQSFDAELSLSQSIWDFIIAEDDSADPARIPVQPQILSQVQRGPTANYVSPKLTTPSPLKRKADQMDDSYFSTPSRSARSALSEMSPSKVNIRAQEKPDTTSAPKFGSSLPSPKRESPNAAETPADILAMISTQDLDDGEFLIDKENTDPCGSASKQKVPQRSSVTRPGSEAKTATSFRQRSVSPHLEDLSDFEDLLDFATEFDDFDDSGLDDATLAGLSTQMPAKNTLVSAGGSPKKARFQGVRVGPIAPPALSRTSPSNEMLPPPSKKQPSAQKRGARNSRQLTQSSSFTFDGVDDDELVDLADQLEKESDSQTAKKARTIPWLHPSQFPPPTPSDREPPRSSS